MKRKTLLIRLYCLLLCLLLVALPACSKTDVAPPQPDDQAPLDGEALSQEDTPEEPEPEPEEEPEPEAPFDFDYDPDKPTLVLTFDDGPSALTTPRLVEELNARGVKATFFVLGKNAENNHDIIDLEFSSGHEVASHGYDHQSKLTALNDQELAYQLEETAKVVRNITGHDPTYLRPPYGTIDKPTAEKIGMPMMLWTIDTRDWESRDAAQVRDHIINDAYDGGVIICHDLYESTVQGVLDAVDILLEEGWQFLTLSQYYQTIDMDPLPGVVYRGSDLADVSK